LVGDLLKLLYEVSLRLLCLLEKVLIVDDVVLGFDKLLEDAFSLTDAFELRVVGLLDLLHYHLNLHLHLLNRMFFCY